MKPCSRYEAEALGLTTEGNPLRPATPTEGFCPASPGVGLRNGPASSREAERGPEGVRRAQRASAPAGRAGPGNSDAQRHRGGTTISPREEPLQFDTADGKRGTQAPPAGLAYNLLEPSARNHLQGAPSVGLPEKSARLLSRRLDALCVASKVAVSPAVEDELNERQSLCDLAGPAELRLGNLCFRLARNRSLDRFYFENADVRCLYDRRGQAGWNVEVLVRASFLGTHTLQESSALVDLVGNALGTVHERRLRRSDLCADFEGFPLNRADAERFVTTHCRIDSFLVDAKDVGEAVDRFTDVREHLSATKRVTGFTISPGNPLMARIYDKTTELKLSGREEKRDMEESLWRRSGWQAGANVTRLEFQLRSEALNEFDLRDPDKLEGSLDGIWQYAVQSWLRLVRPESATRLSRCELDPRWQAVAATIFEHESAPAQRKRVRGGASTENALGTVISRVGGIGKLPTRCNDEFQSLVHADPNVLAVWLQTTLESIFHTGARDAFETLVRKHGVHGAAVRLAAKVNATRARFWSVDDLLGGLLDDPTGDRG